MTPLWLIPGADDTRLIEPPRWSMAQDRVRHVGEIVAVVIAQSLHEAMDAAELVEVDYEALPCVVDVRQAAHETAVRIHDEAPGNQALCFQRGAAGQRAVQRVVMVSVELEDFERFFHGVTVNGLRRILAYNSCTIRSPVHIEKS